MVIKINYKKCCWKDGKCTCSCGSPCKGCVEACPTGALTRGKIVLFNPDECINCKACISACKHNAITFV